MKPAILVSLVILAIGLAALVSVIQTDMSEKQAQIDSTTQKLTNIPKSVDVPIFIGPVDESQSLASLSATAVHIQDRETGTQLLARKNTEPRYPASTAKMMTALVARQIYSLDTPLTVREEAFADGSSIGFQIGEQITVRNLLAVLMIHSGNDAAFVLANNAPGGYQHFIDLMNIKAKQLGLKGSHFENASGLDDPNQQTTAADLALLGDALLEDPFLADLVKTKYLTITDVSGNISHRMVNRDELLGVLPGVMGIKTGTTESAGENLVTALQRNGRQTLYVILGSSERYSEMRRLISWVDKHYAWRTLPVPQP